MIEDTEELFDEHGAIPVWGKTSTTGKVFYTFQLTNKDKYVLFPSGNVNPKAPKFTLKKAVSELGKTEKGE